MEIMPELEETLRFSSEVISWCSLAYGTLQTSFFLGFVLFVEMRDATLAKRKCQLATPFNILLLLMCFAEIVVAISMALAVRNRVFMIPASIALSIAEGCYMNYSWLRSSEIVKEQFPAFVSRAMGRLVKSSTFFFCVQAIPEMIIVIYGDAAPNHSWTDLFYQSSLLVVGGIVVLFDTILIIAFTLFLRKTDIMEHGIDQHFVIIAKTGFVCCCVCYVELGLALASVVLYTYGAVGLLVRNICYAVAQFVLTPLIVMKVQLYWYKKYHSKDGSTKKDVQGTRNTTKQSRQASADNLPDFQPPV